MARNTEQQLPFGFCARTIPLVVIILGAISVSCAPAEPPAGADTGRAVTATPAQLAETAGIAGPSEVLERLLRWDTAGLGFDPEYSEARAALFCYAPQERCLDSERGADRVSIIGGYEVRRIPDRGDTALVVVDYNRHGWIDGTLIGFDSAMAVSDTVRLQWIDGAWRIVRSQLLPQLSPEAALRLYAATPEDSIRMLKAARLRDSGRSDR